MAKRPINYTSRDFDSIKADLINYAQRYYPNSFKDFNEASFGAMMLDMVSYVGDQLSFYLDYEANEGFIDSAIQYSNIVNLARQMGYKMPGMAIASGECSFYVLVPVASSTSGPDINYMPILSKGSTFRSDSGNTYVLDEDVDFSNPNNEATVGRVDDDTGVPTYYAIRAKGMVRSGILRSSSLVLGGYQRFKRLQVDGTNISEIVKVVDSQGNEYFEVDNLSQDVVISEVPNYASDREAVPYIMKIQPVPRRFVVERNSFGDTFLQFGFGSDQNLTKDLIVDPADVVLDTNGRNYITDRSFDPSNLIEGDKFGVVPTDTTLKVVYRSNTSQTINASVGSVSKVVAGRFQFKSEISLDPTVVGTVRSSLEVKNHQPILGDASVLLPDEIRTRAFDSFSSQNRAVTKSDYINFCYRMPAKFGKIKRVNISQDTDSLKRNLNLYALSESPTGNLVPANNTMKTNLKTWLSKYKMVNDSLDVLDGKIINYGINFEVVADINANRYSVLKSCVSELIDKLTRVLKNMGEPINITQIYKFLNDVNGVVDTVSVEIVNNAGGTYSDFYYDISENTSNDGRFVSIPQNAVAEILFPSIDIKGVIR